MGNRVAARAVMSVVLYAAVGIGFGAPVTLQTEIDRDENATILRELIGDDAPQLALPELGNPGCPRASAAREACLDAQIAHFTYQAESIRLRMDVYTWNHVSTIIIFIMVVLIVLVGLFFAGVQFFADRRNERPTEASDLKVSTQGVEVSSSVLGVIILTISLAFFYLYLIYVYPIQEQA